MTANTGPKISSWAMRILLSTPVKIVGWAAAQNDLRPLTFADRDIVEDLAVLRRGRHRPDLRIGIGGIAHFGGPGKAHEPVDELIVDAFLHEQARAGDAGLPGRGEDAGDRALDRIVENRIVEDDVRRLAAQFEGDALQPPGRAFIDPLPGHLAAGKGDLGDLRMGDERLADLGPEAGDDVDDTRRKP